MLHLLRIEWLKLNRYKAFLILFALFIVSVFGLNYATHEILSHNKDMSTMLLGKSFSFPAVWNTVPYLSNYLLFIPGLIIILIMSNEYSYRTHRQNIIDGVSRSRFILTKINLVLLFSLFLTLLVFLTALFFGLTEKGSVFSFAGIKNIAYFFIQSVAYLSLALLLIVLLKRSGLTIGIYFLYIFILENVFSLVLNRMTGTLGDYLPMESVDNLIPLPVAWANMGDKAPDEFALLVVACLWISIILWATYALFTKRDL